jgi:hypothetical protein
MVELSTTPNLQKRRRGKLPPLTADELAAVNVRLRPAYHLVEEVHAIISDRVPRSMVDKYLKTQWSLRMLGENLNNRIDWLKPSREEIGHD